MKRLWRWREFGIQTRMLVIILPLIVVPVLILGAVGFVASSREAAKTSTRYLAQRETDLRTLAENPGIANYSKNRAYGLTGEAEVARRELERAFKRFADRSNSVEPIYREVRYVDDGGLEIAKVVDGSIRTDHERVATAPFFTAVRRLPAGQTCLSPVGSTMVYAIPVHQAAGEGAAAVFLGAVVLDFT